MMMLPQRTSFVQVSVDSESERSADARHLSEVYLARMVNALSSTKVTQQGLEFLGAESFYLFEWISER